MLVPLDGTVSAALAVQQATVQFAGSGVEILALHVFDAITVPRFWDHPQDNHHAWSQELLARWCPTRAPAGSCGLGDPAGRC